MKRPWCFDCPLAPLVEDKLSYCPDPATCPKGRGQKEGPRVVTWLLVGLFCVVAVGGYSIGHATEQAVVTPTTLSEEEAIAALEVIVNTPPPEPEPTADERIAAALEFQNILGLDNVEA